MLEYKEAKKSRKFPKALGEPFLSGFMYARANEAVSMPLSVHGLFSSELDISRHPDRQGDPSVIRYSMCHDVYSLGVILLEIGL